MFEKALSSLGVFILAISCCDSNDGHLDPVVRNCSYNYLCWER